MCAHKKLKNQGKKNKRQPQSKDNIQKINK